MRLDIAAAALMLVWAAVSPLAAQKRPGAPPPPPPPRKQNAPARGPNRANANPGKQNPVEQLERFEQMPPEEREKALSKLPAARRARVEKQLANLDKLPPEQRERRIARLKALQSLPPERRQAVQQEIEDLRALSPRLRAARLSGDELKTFSPLEQQLIRDTFPRAARGLPENP
jgi:hypothetical protein